MFGFIEKEFKFLSLILTIFTSFTFSSCATVKPMALNQKTTGLQMIQESIAIMTVKTSNQHRPQFQPDVWYVSVWSRDEKTPTKHMFRVDSPCNKNEKAFNEYLISMQLPPGQYKLRELAGFSGIFPIHGNFQVPLYLDFELNNSQIVYLGRIEAVNRERKSDDELRAGSILPLLDQAVAGFSGGTFDIKICDDYDHDITLFKDKFPCLKNCDIEKAILPQWYNPAQKDR